MATTRTTQQPIVPEASIPPLEQGDHLTREEFERRYNAMPELKKAELINGEVQMTSAVRWNQRAGPHADLIGWLVTYRAGTPGVRAGDNGSLRLDLENMPQPDASLIIEPAFGGQVKLSADDYIVGAPEWLGEVSASSVSFDLNTKLRLYRRHNVLEYLVWRVLERAVDWFVLRQGEFVRMEMDSAGLLQSEVFPGLVLDPAALARGDMATVLRVLQQGMNSATHAAFCARLAQEASRIQEKS